MNFLQSNRPRKLMATAALSVPLLAAGSTVLFSSAASAAVTCEHGCPGSGGTPSASASPTCTCMHTTPPTTPPPTTTPPTTPGSPTPSVTPSVIPSVVPTGATTAPAPLAGLPGRDHQPVRGCAAGRRSRHRWWRQHQGRQ